MKQSRVHRRVTGHGQEGHHRVGSVFIGMLMETLALARTDPFLFHILHQSRYATLRWAALCFWSILGSATPLSHANKFVPD